jgi:hypothetical protein
MGIIRAMSVETQRFGIQKSPEPEREFPRRASGGLPCTAELAECTCPEFCERDHDND